MTHKGSLQSVIALSLALATGLTVGLTGSPSAQAQFRPPNLGTLKTTAGGATRSGTCTTEKTALTALVPASKMALTTEKYPVFFLYLPKNNAQAAEFTLKDEADRDVYRTTIPLTGRSGVVSFQLPAEAPGLAVGKDYQWFFNVICQPTDRLRDDFVAAWIRRVEPNPDLSSTLKNAAARQIPNVYAQAGIWQDTLVALAKLRRDRPTDFTLNEEWSSLLKSQGLSQISRVAGSPSVNQLKVEATKAQ